MNPAVTKLLQRQQNILDHLDKLKTEVLGLSKKAGITEDELNIVGKASVVCPFIKTIEIDYNSVISNISN